MKPALKAALGVFAAMLLLGGAALWYISGKSLGLSAGRCLITEDGVCLLIANDSPIVLSNRTAREDLFSGLDSGDELLVLHDGVQETYPARTGAYGVWKKADGDISDIPLSVLTSLAEMGWKVPIDSEEEVLQNPLPQQAFLSAVAWANYGDEGLLWSRALNRGKATVSNSVHLPVLRFDSAEALTAFKRDIGEEFTTQQGWDEIPSFDAVTAHMDEEFFAGSSLLLVYVWSGSCTWRYGVSHVDIEEGTLTVHVQRTDNFEVGDCAMAGWFITVSVPRETLEGITAFDARLGNGAE